MNNQNEILVRIQRIFENLLNNNSDGRDCLDFEKLIRHLANKDNIFVLQAPFAIAWVDKTLSLLEQDFGQVDSKVISFMLHFTRLLTTNEWIVLGMKENRIMTRIIEIVDKNLRLLNSSNKIATIRLFANISKYSLGLGYLRSMNAWRYLHDFCNRDHTVYVVREARELLYDMLYKFSVKTNDEQIVLEILHEILQPIMNNVYNHNNEQIKISVGDSELQHAMSSSLDLISYIFQQTLESEEKTNIAHLCLQHYEMPVTFWKLFDLTFDQQFVEKIITALTSFNFAILVYEKWESGTIAPENFNQFGVLVFNLAKFCLGRHDCVNFLKVAELNHVIWKKLGARAPKEILIENERIQFENQLIAFHLLPMLSILKNKQIKEEELFDQYILKLFEITCEHTMRICYGFRDIFKAEGPSWQVAADLVYKSIHGILSMENILEREQAIVVFQALTYCLGEFTMNSYTEAESTNNETVDVSNSWPKGPELILKMPNVLYSILIALQRLIHRYNISWKESIETICLVNSVAFMLKSPNMTSRVADQAIKLVQLSVEHFLSPNMALLVDNLKGSGLLCLGPIIVERCHDPAWEVRDSILELTTSIANISQLKFPAFQKFLFDFNICPIVVQMAQHDEEPYVRASAFKCLTQMIGINPIWEKDLNKLEVIQHLFDVLYNESEGIVRREAICTLTQIFDTRKIPAQCHELLYSTFAYAVVVDLHWEVKLNGLHFWELEIEKQCTNQGMIDDTFPTVTFSKADKKIVTLNESEIKLRIIRIFNNLAQLGCLGVLLNCLNNDYELEVAKEAVNIVRRLSDKLTKYDFENIFELHKNVQHYAIDIAMLEAEEPIEDTNVDMSEPALNIELNSEEIIEKILSSQDIQYVMETCEEKLRMNDKVELQHLDPTYYKKFTGTSAKDFLVAIKTTDFNQKLQSQNEWFLGSDSLLSLLDDMLIALEPKSNDIFADCY